MEEIGSNRQIEGASSGPGPACVICGEASGTLRCSNCHKVAYCSKEHQKQDWRQHKATCFPMDIRQDSVRGRYLVATRLIAAGEVFLKEKPLICGPSLGDTEGNARICLSCFQPARSPYRCSQCWWPVCNESCEKAPIHSKFECSVLAKKRVRPTCIPDLDNECITTLRGLLLKKLDPATWEQLLQLEKHEERSGQNLVVELVTESVITFLQKCGLEEEFDKDTIAKVCGAIRINAMGSGDTPASNPKQIYRCSKYLYRTGSMMMHGCIPNIQPIIQLESSLNLVALVPIQPGDPIRTLYTKTMQCTLQRRAHLESNYYFSCNCERCADPAECGTNFSSVACENCKDKGPGGHLLSIDPLDSCSAWICGVCSLEKSGDQVRNLVQCVQAEIDAVPYEDSVDSLEKLEKILRKYQGPVLHPNHALMVNTEYDILQRIDYLLQTNAIARGPPRIKLAKRQIDLCRKCLQISGVLKPGCSGLRGQMLYLFQNGILNYLVQHGPGAQGKHERMELWDEAMDSRKEGSEILSRFPTGSHQWQLAKSMAEGKKDLEMLKIMMGLQQGVVYS